MSFATIPQIKQWIKNIVFKKHNNDLSQYQPDQVKADLSKIEEWISGVDKEELSNLQIANFTYEQMLEFVKKMDPKGERTIGVLTKLDLMNDEQDIVKYLNNQIHYLLGFGGG